MYQVSGPKWIKYLPGLYWPKPLNPRGVFITFDDGPHPSSTPKVLALLEQYDAKATFFCLGRQAVLHPGYIELIKEKGHTIGNHGFNHLRGWKTKRSAYLADIDKAALLTSDRLFRPPYGQITPLQWLSVRRKGYNIVGWDLMPGDFDTEISAETCWQRVEKNIGPGAVIVLHENEKSADKMLYVLPRLLELLKARNLVAEKIIL